MVRVKRTCPAPNLALVYMAILCCGILRFVVRFEPIRVLNSIESNPDRSDSNRIGRWIESNLDR